MMLLVCFDLPRYNTNEQKQATAFRKRLVSLGFHMKQYSLYERVVQRPTTRDKLIAQIREHIPDTGEITIYELPDQVNDGQITVLGNQVVRKSTRKSRLIVL